MTLDRERWTEIDRLFRGALELDTEERSAWLAAECDDPSLRAAVERFLGNHDDLGDFLTSLDTGAAAALVAGTAPEVSDPETVGPYRIVRRLAHGGMGVVYLARDERLDRSVAVKCLPSWLDTDPGMRQRFLAEARAASRLDHPHIATVHDVGETPDGGLYIAMSYYEGATLAERITDGTLDAEETRDVAVQVARALAAAHAAGIVHRDIKPANVIVTPDGRAKVLDFGIAKTEGSQTTRAGVRLGTVAYMSPEQTRGEPVDARTDVWSFGAMLYEMLTGRRPFGGSDDAVVIHGIRHDPPRPVAELRPDIAPEMSRLVERCLEKDPARRYADGGELVEGLVGRAVPETANGRAPATLRLLAAFAVLAGVALLVGWLLERNPGGSGAEGLDRDLVMVLPFTPVAQDTILLRHGRNLAITLSTALDGLGELRTIDASTVAAQTRSRTGASNLRSGIEFARELGAGRVLHGTLLREAGEYVRADIGMYLTQDAATEPSRAGPADATAAVREAARAELADIGALTDSVTRALLPHFWPSERTPEIEPNALSERPLPALRAFLDGELATADGRWREAPEHFVRAIAVDSTFWLAYARYVEAMDYWSRPVEPEIRAALNEHLADLPPHERSLLESRQADSLSERLAGARAFTERFPTSWRGWFGLAEQLIHNTMFLGTTLAEAREAIERTTLLNPNRGTHWQHLIWLALTDRDTATARRALEELDRLAYDSATLREAGLDQLAYYRFLHGLVAAGDSIDEGESAWLQARADSLAAQLVGYAGPIDLEELGGGVSVYGPHRGEILLARSTLARPVPAAARAGTLHGLASAWAGRGAWDSVVVALDRYVAEVDGTRPLQHATRLTAVGQWLGALGTEEAAAWRAALGGSERAGAQDDSEPGESLDAVDRAERAWLDGIVSFARSDETGLAAAHQRLVAMSSRPESSSDSLVASILARSLAAHRAALTGRVAVAADSLLELERQRAERLWFRGLGNSYPYLTAVNRIDAARWLLDTGRPGEAARLLRWHETVQFPAHLAHRADASLRGIIHFYRGRAEAELGRPDRALRHFERVLSELDHPAEALGPLLDTARAAIEP